jgi:hypothetical protein
MITYYFGIALAGALVLGFLAAQVYELSQDHPGEVYGIWYFFSLLFLIFVALYILAEWLCKKEVTEVLGEFLAPAFKWVYDALTNFQGELILVAAFVYVAIAPQVLTYLLSGFSGAASLPQFIQTIRWLAIWSVIKFMAGLAGILLADALAKLFLGKPVSSYDFFHAAFFIAGAFYLAVLHHKFELDWEKWELPVTPGLRIRVRLVHMPRLVKIHEFFTRHTEEPRKPNPEEYIHQLVKIHEFFTRHTEEPGKPNAEEEPEPEWEWNLWFIILRLRGWVPIAIRDGLAQLKRTKRTKSPN